MGWLIGYSIPWDKFPKQILNACENELQPHPLPLNEMKRILVDDILRQSKQKPSKKDFEAVALKVVSKYPKSFQDTIGGISLGKGYESLAIALYDRCNYITKRRSFYNSSPPSKKELAFQKNESYGCKIRSWKPELLSSENNEDDKIWLQEEYKKVDKDKENVKIKMEPTYTLQRQMINDNALITQLMSEWPFLFEHQYLLSHYDELIDAERSSQALFLAMQQESLTILR